MTAPADRTTVACPICGTQVRPDPRLLKVHIYRRHHPLRVATLVLRYLAGSLFSRRRRRAISEALDDQWRTQRQQQSGIR